MARNPRRVEVLYPVIDNIEGEQEIEFKDLLYLINKKNYSYKDRGFSYEILEEKEGLIIGYVITYQNSDLPPKKNHNSGKLTPLNLDTEVESLAFANAFLYDSRKNVFIYEINKSGCYTPYLKNCIELIYKEINDSLISLKFTMILKPDAYEKIQNMNNVRNFSLQVAYPQELSRVGGIQNDSLLNNIIGLTTNSNTKTLKIEQSAGPINENPLGLSGIVEKVKGLLNIDKKNIEKAEVIGYVTDPENPEKNIRNVVDLIGNSFKNSYFYIPRVQLHSDLQPTDRREGIKKVYYKIKPELNRIFGE